MIVQERVRGGNPLMEPFWAPQTEFVRYQVKAFAPTTAGDWSTNHLAEQNPSKRAAFEQRFVMGFIGLNVREAFVPSTETMSATILPPEAFTKRIELKCNVTLLTTHEPCEGTEIEKGQAFAMTPAGCALLVFTFRDRLGRERCIVTHAGKASLLDLRKILSKKKRRVPASVIDAVVDYAISEGARPEDIQLRSFFAIPWEAYPHSVRDPRYRKKNLALRDHLATRFPGSRIIRYRNGHEHLSLEALIEALAHERGIGKISFERPLEADGPFALTTHAVPELSGLARNLVVFVRYA